MANVRIQAAVKSVIYEDDERIATRYTKLESRDEWMSLEEYEEPVQTVVYEDSDRICIQDPAGNESMMPLYIFNQYLEIY